MELEELFIWLLGGGGAGAIAYWVIEHIPALEVLDAEMKRYASLGIAVLIGCLAYGVELLFGLEIAPATLLEWARALCAVISLVLLGSQGIHGVLVLHKKVQAAK